ncbi:Kinesin motor domain [Carpediemonas membranifera]|uniref:Kinesin-like protein n=1 Tax=Carpediemonas membranifera TaxID=201153 RepID=A0A8J6B4G0_9EUKA|nr:Kinesin motor domain [Carpediemonas membranifera]|eukprot:KAG9392702.1 Kinesin motor domain [Carpediemonas membranifera]
MQPMASRNNSRASTPRIRRGDSVVALDQVKNLTNAGIATSPENVKVVVRVRPPNNRETTLDVVAEADEPNTIHVRQVTKTFDRVFGPGSKQSQVYNDVASNSVSAVLDGFNSTIIAYGQTGTGKTYTMTGGGAEVDLNSPTSVPEEHVADSVEDSAGIIPRAASHIFRFVQDKLDEVEINVYCSYCEIYNERLFDLLYLRDSDHDLPGHLGPGIVSVLPTAASNGTRAALSALQQLEIREDKERGIFVQGLTEVLCSSVQDVLSLIAQGVKNRAVRATDYNAWSSRSHSIFQLIVESRPIDGREPIITRSKLNLVDLAGSEKWRTHMEMQVDRIAELTAINQSLSTLGKCIHALTQAGRSHIPFRDSKLTRLLADSLGGNAKTVFIVTVSPSVLNEEETLSTVKFADRAKRVVTHVKRNEVLDGTMLIKRYEAEIHRLRTLLSKGGVAEDSQRLAASEEENLRLREENSRLTRQLYLVREENRALAASQGGGDPTAVRNEFLEHRVQQMEAERYDLLARISDGDSFRGWVDSLKIDRAQQSVSAEQKLSLMERSLASQSAELQHTKKLFVREVRALQDELSKKTQLLLSAETDLAKARRTAVRVSPRGEAVLPTDQVERVSRSVRSRLAKAVRRYDEDGRLAGLAEDVCNQAAAALYSLYAEHESVVKQLMPAAQPLPPPNLDDLRRMVRSIEETADHPPSPRPPPARPPHQTMGAVGSEGGRPMSPRETHVSPRREAKPQSIAQSLDRFFHESPRPAKAGGDRPESALKRLQHLNSLLANPPSDRKILPPPPGPSTGGGEPEQLRRVLDRLGPDRLAEFAKKLKQAETA